MYSVSVRDAKHTQNVQIVALCCHLVARQAHCKPKILSDVCRSERWVGGAGVWPLSSSACGEGTALEALPARAAETGYCWKAPCWEFPEASVAIAGKRMTVKMLIAL